MAAQTIFKRYELKYMITLEQKEKIVEAMKPYMELDKYGRTTIRNLYFDTDTYLLIRRSIEKPDYKEKLRVRSYERANGNSKVFVELKKKYESVVYKRRASLPWEESLRWLMGSNQSGQEPLEKVSKEDGYQQDSQIAKEIDYFLKYYGSLRPMVFLSYEREAFFTKEKSDFRVTFDEQILVRQENLSLDSEVYGIPILPEGMALMEIKCSGGIPLWMTEILSKEKVYKTSFSKYGTAYRNLIYPNLQQAYG